MITPCVFAAAVWACAEAAGAMPVFEREPIEPSVGWPVVWRACMIWAVFELAAGVAAEAGVDEVAGAAFAAAALAFAEPAGAFTVVDEEELVVSVESAVSVWLMSINCSRLFTCTS